MACNNYPRAGTYKRKNCYLEVINRQAVRIAVMILVCMLMSCRQEKMRLPDISFEQQKQEPAEPVSSYRIIKGLFVVGKTMQSFKICDRPEIRYFVIDSTGQMGALYKTIFLNSPAFPFEYVYTEVKGEVIPNSPEMEMRGFDSALVVYEILTFEQKNYRNTCIPYDFWALGSGPDWSLQVSAREGIIVLKDYGSNTVYLFEYFAPKVVNEEVFTYYSNNYATQTAISAVFKKMPCQGATASNAYNFSATIVLNGKRYSGCAIQGGEEML